MLISRYQLPQPIDTRAGGAFALLLDTQSGQVKVLSTKRDVDGYDLRSLVWAPVYDGPNDSKGLIGQYLLAGPIDTLAGGAFSLLYDSKVGTSWVMVPKEDGSWEKLRWHLLEMPKPLEKQSSNFERPQIGRFEISLTDSREVPTTGLFALLIDTTNRDTWVLANKKGTSGWSNVEWVPFGDKE